MKCITNLLLSNRPILQKISTIAIALLLCMICFMSFYIKHKLVIPALVGFSVISLLLQREVPKLSTRTIYLLVTFFIWFICSFFASEFVSSYSFYKYFIIAIALVLVDDVRGWQSSFMYFVLIVCGIYTLTTAVQYYFPSLIDIFVTHTLNERWANTNRGLASNNAYAGITNQTGVNSYYITVFILITFCILVTRNKSNTNKFVILDFILLLSQGLGFFALILTKRRISIIVVVVCLFLITLVSLERNKKNYKTIGVFIGLISLFALLFLYSSPGKSFFGRIFLSSLPTDSQRTLFETLDYYSSGRLILWKDSLELIKQRPWFGWGWFSALDLMTQYGRAEIPHNAFIQVLLELGIIGLFAYLSLISYYTFHLIVSLKNEISLYSLFALGLHVLFLLWSMTENAIWDGFPFFMYILSYSLLTTQEKQTSISYV